MNSRWLVWKRVINWQTVRAQTDLDDLCLFQKSLISLSQYLLLLPCINTISFSNPYPHGSLIRRRKLDGTPAPPEANAVSRKPPVSCQNAVVTTRELFTLGSHSTIPSPSEASSSLLQAPLACAPALDLQ